MLGLAACLHLVGLYLFPIVSPPSQPSLISPATFYLLNPDAPQSSSFHSWVESEDPSLFSQVSSSTRILFPDIPYIPSYEHASHSLAVPQKPPLPIPIPRGPSIAPVELDLPTRPVDSLSHKEIQGTQLILGEGLNQRYIQALPPQGLMDSPTTSYLPCVFLAAVSPEGKFRHVFLLKSSGQEELDQNALRNLQQLQLNSIGTPQEIWGTVTYLWGLPQKVPASLHP